MTDIGLEVFDTTKQKTMTWIKDLMEELHWEDRHRAYLVLRGHLHLVRDVLTVEEVAHFSAQLPLLVRGVYFEGWDPTRNPRSFPSAELETIVKSYFPEHIAYQYERIMRACVRVMARHID